MKIKLKQTHGFFLKTHLHTYHQKKKSTVIKQTNKKKKDVRPHFSHTHSKLLPSNFKFLHYH